MVKVLIRSSICLAFLLGTLNSYAYRSTKQLNDPSEVRGFHIDLRIQPMKMPALKAFVRQLAANGINTILMEWEGTYPYAEEPVISSRYAYSRKEIVGFLRYCHQLNLDVIPLQQSFGHVEYILRHYKYAGIREDATDFSQVCPSKLEQDKRLFTKLYKDMIRIHNSPYIHIGGDETHLLGHCEICRRKAAEVGLSRVYFDYIKMLCEVVVSLGQRPLVWADMALKYPEYIHELPKQTIFVDWNYGWGEDKFGDHEKLINSRYEIWGAPAIRSDPDDYYLTDWYRHFKNIQDFVPECRLMGYKGIIMTSWSTSGVYLPIFNADNDLADLYPVRHVYPISAFELLVSAFTASLKDTSALNIDHFINSYCRKTYGFNAEQTNTFKKALVKAPYKVVQGKVLSPVSMTVGQLIDSAIWSANVLRSMRPKKGIKGFQHYVLMADIRVFYLKVMFIEAAMNQGSFSIQQKNSYILQLKRLTALSKSLDERFVKLNEPVLYNGSLQEENDVRNYKLTYLYNQLAGIK
jgi:hexosaminidase